MFYYSKILLLENENNDRNKTNKTKHTDFTPSLMNNRETLLMNGIIVLVSSSTINPVNATHCKQ